MRNGLLCVPHKPCTLEFLGPIVDSPFSCPADAFRVENSGKDLSLVRVHVQLSIASVGLLCWMNGVLPTSVLYNSWYLPH